MFYNTRVATSLCIFMSILAVSVCAKIHKFQIERNEKMNDQKPNRPQEPKPPYPYHQEEVRYENKSCNIMLSGTLTLPISKEKSSAVILISGMGPNDRDYTMLDHKLFLVLADHLTRKGIAVLRFDKRGVGKSTGQFDATLTSRDFADDVLAGVQYLKGRKEINAKQIGLIGHSEGGMIAPMVAAESGDVSFLVLMAAAVATCIDDTIEHVSMQLRADGATEEMIALDRKIRRQMLEIVNQEANYDIAEEKLRKAILQYLKELSEEQKSKSEKLPFAISSSNYDNLIKMFNSPWYRFFLTYDPIATLRKIKVPVLAINGELDFITSSQITLPIIEQSLGQSSSKDYKTISLPKLNHWFQTCQTGAMIEYGAIEETISPLVLELISKWIQERTDNKKQNC